MKTDTYPRDINQDQLLGGSQSADTPLPEELQSRKYSEPKRCKTKGQ